MFTNSIISSPDVLLFTDHIRKVLPELATAQLGLEFEYQSLPLCVIDAVYSIGVNFAGVINTVDRYCKYFELQDHRDPKDILPSKDKQESISSLCQRFEKFGVDGMVDKVFCNRQRTSTRNGILKADAVNRFALVLQKYKVEYLLDVEKIINSKDFENDICAIPGQKSGISLKYFFMLTGFEDLIKPDRMILRFIEAAIGKSVSLSDATVLLKEAVDRLKEFDPASYGKLTMRLLDNKIWAYQRSPKDIATDGIDVESLWQKLDNVSDPMDKQKEFYAHKQATLEKTVYAGMGCCYAFFRMKNNHENWFVVWLGGSDGWSSAINIHNFSNKELPAPRSLKECIEDIEKNGIKP